MARQLSLLLDTNVLLDEYLPGRPSSNASRRLIACAHQRNDKLLFCARAMVDVYYQIALTFKRMVRAEKGVLLDADALAIQEVVWGCIDNLCELATPVGISDGDIWLARKYKRFNTDLEDNFVLACAERIQADYLVTNDQQLIRKSTIAAMSPEDMLSLIEAVGL